MLYFWLIFPCVILSERVGLPSRIVGAGVCVMLVSQSNYEVRPCVIIAASYCVWMRGYIISDQPSEPKEIKKENFAFDY